MAFFREIKGLRLNTMVCDCIRWYTSVNTNLFRRFYEMAKVALSTKIPEELKAELEEQAKKEGITLSEHVGNLLSNSKKDSEKSEHEFERLIKELDAKNHQIETLLKMQKNEQEVRLYHEKTLLIEKEEQQKKSSVINEPQKNGHIDSSKKWWQVWR